MEADEFNGKVVAAARVLLGWSQQALADAANVSQSAVARMERSSDPRVSTSHRVLRALTDAGIEFIDSEEKLGVVLKRTGLEPTPGTRPARHHR